MTYHLGTYDTQEQAACAYDKAAVLLRPLDTVKLNFPLEDYLDERGRLVPEHSLEAIRAGTLTGPALRTIMTEGQAMSSSFRGINQPKGKSRWAAQVYIPNGKKCHLGFFDTAEEAARTFDKAALRVKPRDKVQLNFPLQDYLDVWGNLVPAEPELDRLLDNMRG